MAEKTKGKGLFDAVKGAFFEEESGHPQSAAMPPEAAPRVTVTTAPRTAAGASAVPDAKIREVIEAAVHEAALPAYVAFKQLLDSMKAAIPDERTRIQAALGALSTHGHDLKAVLTDIDECFAALDKKEAEAQAAAEKSLAREVGGLEQELQQTTERIGALQKEIDDLRSGQSRLKESITHERDQILATRDTFAATVQEMRRELQDMKSKLSSTK